MEVGALYHRYDLDSQRCILVRDIVVDSQTLESIVIYDVMYGNWFWGSLRFARPLTDLVEKVEHKGKIVPKFIKAKL